MSPKPASTIMPDADKTREQLLAELQELRARQQSDKRLSILSDIASLLLISENPHEILDYIFKMLSGHLGLEAYFNYLVVGDERRMRLYEYGGISAEVAKEIEWLEFGQAVCGCVARDRKRIVVEDVQCSTDPTTDLIRSLGITAYYCHPLIAHEKLLGTLSFGTRNRTKFEEDEIQLMHTVCDLVASSLERAGVLHDLKNSKAELEIRAEELKASVDELNSKNSELENQITERTRAEEALRESERFLDNVFEGIQEGICILDEDMNIVKANRAMERWYSHVLPLVGKKCYQAYLGSTSACAVCPSLRAMKEKTMQTGTVPYTNESGVAGWMDLYSSPMEDDRGNVIGVIVHVRDISERKRAEDALRESEKRFYAFMDNSPTNAWMKDEHGVYVFLNKSCEDLIGIRHEDWLGKTDHDVFPREIADRLCENDRQVLASGRIIAVEEETMSPDGRHIYWLSYKFPFKDASGKKYVGGIAIEITERKKTEKELANAKAQAELYLDLMGHDINNLHQVALGYLELARDMPASEEQAMFLNKPVEVLQRSAMLISNVRKLQKLRDGVFKTELVDVCKLLVDVQREFGGAPHKQVTLNLNGRECCLVRANELLHDVFANLVSNAIKHTGDHADITIGLDTIEDNGKRYYRIVVEDDGPGIPNDFKATIFNRALKGTDKVKGMGLGLYLVKSLVDSYGGRVWVEDRIMGDHTKGARFVAMLPAVEK